MIDRKNKEVSKHGMIAMMQRKQELCVTVIRANRRDIRDKTIRYCKTNCRTDDDMVHGGARRVRGRYRTRIG